MYTLTNLHLLTETIETQLSTGLSVLYVVLGALVTLLIFFTVITWFGYIPITRMVKSRTDMIQREIDEAFASNEMAEKNNRVSSNKLQLAVTEYDKAISDAQIEATKSKKEIVVNAKEEAKQIILKARSSGLEVKKDMKEEAMKEISDIAILAASKIMEKEIDKTTNQKLIDDLLEQIK